MNRFSLPILTVIAATSLLLGGCCGSDKENTLVEAPLPGQFEMAMASAMPTFGVGDELGWLAFGELALAPQPGPPTDVLVIAQAEPVDAESFDWVGQYLALAE